MRALSSACRPPSNVGRRGGQGGAGEGGETDATTTGMMTVATTLMMAMGTSTLMLRADRGGDTDPRGRGVSVIVALLRSCLEEDLSQGDNLANPPVGIAPWQIVPSRVVGLRLLRIAMTVPRVPVVKSLVRASIHNNVHDSSFNLAPPLLVVVMKLKAAPHVNTPDDDGMMTGTTRGGRQERRSRGSNVRRRRPVRSRLVRVARVMTTTPHTAAKVGVKVTITDA